MLFAISNLRKRASSYYKGKRGFSRRSRGRGSYYSGRGGGAFILTGSDCPYSDF